MTLLYYMDVIPYLDGEQEFAMGYSIFYPYRGVESKLPGGAPGAFSKGVKD